jgi:hypothetical protein
MRHLHGELLAAITSSVFGVCSIFLAQQKAESETKRVAEKNNLIGALCDYLQPP